MILPLLVERGKGGDAIKVELSEEDIRKGWPWDYPELLARLRSRYGNFVANNHFHKIRAEIENDERLYRIRYVDPVKNRGTKKRFYNPNILPEFDKHYTKR